MRLDADQIRKHIEALNRDPFRQILAEFLVGAPDLESIKAFATKAPDRWAQAVSIMSKGAGFSEKIQETNILININNASDTELSLLLAKKLNELNQIQALPALEAVTEEIIEDD